MWDFTVYYHVYLNNITGITLHLTTITKSIIIVRDYVMKKFVKKIYLYFFNSISIWAFFHRN